MKINPYLMFNGNAEAAFLFYQQVLGGELELTRYREMPDSDSAAEPEWADKVAHVSLQLGDRCLMASDAPPPYQQGLQGFSLAVWVENAAECDRVFNALAEGGWITMPLAETSWSDRFGMCTDPFGVAWMVGLPDKS